MGDEAADLWRNRVRDLEQQIAAWLRLGNAQHDEIATLTAERALLVEVARAASKAVSRYKVTPYPTQSGDAIRLLDLLDSVVDDSDDDTIALIDALAALVARHPDVLVDPSAGGAA